MSGPVLAATRGAARTGGRPLLVLGPSLGTSARTLWGRCRADLSSTFDVIAWDLPGHGRSPRAADAFTVADLATAVLDAVAATTGDEDGGVEDRGDDDSAGAGRFHYAGDSLGGAVGLQLLLDHPDRILSATLLCTGARIGTPQAWHERAELVRAGGTGAVVEMSRGRWFGPGFVDREPDVTAALLDALRATDPTDYARACACLAAFDVRDRLGEIHRRVLAVAGAADVATPPGSLTEIASGVVDGRVEILDGVGHLAPAEAPADVVRLLTAHATAVREP